MLTETMTEIITTLTTKVRLMTTDQLAQAWFSSLKRPKESANRAARKLTSDGLASKSKAMVAYVDATAPMASWKPDAMPKQAWETISYANQKRWNIPPLATTILTPTNLARSQFGGVKRSIRQAEISHDVTVTSVYLSLPTNQKQNWVLEDCLADEFNGKRPDAVIQVAPPILIDVIGRGYSAAKIENIWNQFSNQHVELW